MKPTTLNTADRATVNALCGLMMEMNDRNDANADGCGTCGTYGHIYTAIMSFVLNQTGVDISNGGGRHGWNLGGNADFAADIQAVIDFEITEAIQRHAAANDAEPVTDSAGHVALLCRHYDDDGAEIVRHAPDPCDHHAPAAWLTMTPEQAAAAAV